MKKATAIVIALAVALSLTVSAVPAGAADQAAVSQTIQALGIITGDENGNLNLSGNVTRAQFAKMIIAASSYRDTISPTASSSPFKDVRYSHWAASYIQAAVSAGWLTGYSDGTFRPDSNVRLEEAVSAVLKMLGYTASDFYGAFPDAQLAKYRALGLDENISKTQGAYLSRQDCMYLFYNLMGAKTKSGSYYAATLGYSVSSSGELDYSALIIDEMRGPFIVESTSWSASLPFATSAATVYLNGSVSGVSSVSLYDVYYYNENMRTVWIYRNQVSGVYTAATPSAAAPSSVTVAGKTYTIASASAGYDLSTVGPYHIGDTVTLLLGMDGTVVGVASSEELNTTKYGFVTAAGKSTYTDGNGNTYTSNTITVACADGASYDYEYSGSISTGSLVKVSLSGGRLSIAPLSVKTLGGKVNAAGTALGSYTFADDVQIMDSTPNGSFIRIYPSRIAGLTLSTSNVRYYELNGAGEISCLILNDVTGDMYSYGIVTSANVNLGTTNLSASYAYLIDGVSGSYSSSSKAFPATAGPALFEFIGNSLVQMKNLTGIPLTSLNSLYAVSGGDQYALGNGVSVYVDRSGSYYLSSVSAVSGTSSYTLYGYYDKPADSGGLIRVIVAYEK